MPKLFDVVLDPATAKVVPEPSGDHLVYFDGPTNELSLMVAGSLRLKPGMSPHPPHKHPEEEFMLVAEGTGEIQVGEKVTKVGPGSMMYCDGGTMHAIVNTGSEPLLFYYYKWLSK
jgi:mannose-6-phosphate isomerase-like protein (cupin superfamily)